MSSSGEEVYLDIGDVDTPPLPRVRKSSQRKQSQQGNARSSDSVTNTFLAPTLSLKLGQNRTSGNKKQYEPPQKSGTKSGTKSARKSHGVITTVRATFQYRKQERNELNFDAGEMIEVIGKPAEEWWMGRNSKGEVGIFPVTYTAPLEAVPAQQSPQQSNLVKALVSPRPTVPAADPLGKKKRGKMRKKKLASVGRSSKQNKHASGEDQNGSSSGAASNEKLHKSSSNLMFNNASASIKARVGAVRAHVATAVHKKKLTIVRNASRSSDPTPRDEPPAIDFSVGGDDQTSYAEYGESHYTHFLDALLQSISQDAIPLPKTNTSLVVGSTFHKFRPDQQPERHVLESIFVETMRNFQMITGDAAPAFDSWSEERRASFEDIMGHVWQKLFVQAREAASDLDDPRTKQLHALATAHLIGNSLAVSKSTLILRNATLQEMIASQQLLGTNRPSYKVPVIAVVLMMLVLRGGGLIRIGLVQSGTGNLRALLDALSRGDDELLDSFNDCRAAFSGLIDWLCQLSTPVLPPMHVCAKAVGDSSKVFRILYNLSEESRHLLYLLSTWCRLLVSHSSINGIMMRDLAQIFAPALMTIPEDASDALAIDFVETVFLDFPGHPLGERACGYNVMARMKPTDNFESGTVTSFDGERLKYSIKIGLNTVWLRDNPDLLKWESWSGSQVIPDLSALFFSPFSFEAMSMSSLVSPVLSVLEKRQQRGTAAAKEDVCSLQSLFVDNPSLVCAALTLLNDDPNSRSVIPTFTTNLCAIFVYHGRDQVYLERVVYPELETEVTSTNMMTTLFRGNSLGVRLIKGYVVTIGRKFLRLSLSDCILHLVSDSALDQVEQNSTEWWDLVGTFTSSLLGSIVNKRHLIPNGIRAASAHVGDVVASHFGAKEPEARLVGIGAILFLRFICPAVMNPVRLGVVSSSIKISDKAKKMLISVTSSLQALANQTSFSPAKPAAILNELMEGPWKHSMVSFLDHCSVYRPDQIEETPIPTNTYEPALFSASIEMFALAEHLAEVSPVFTTIF